MKQFQRGSIKLCFQFLFNLFRNNLTSCLHLLMNSFLFFSNWFFLNCFVRPLQLDIVEKISFCFTIYFFDHLILHLICTYIYPSCLRLGRKQNLYVCSFFHHDYSLSLYIYTCRYIYKSFSLSLSIYMYI